MPNVFDCNVGSSKKLEISFFIHTLSCLPTSRYRKEHPDAPIKDKDEFEEWFESDNQRELRQIFQGQSQMFEVTRELNRKLDEIIGRQERTLSLMSSLQAGGGVPVGKPLISHVYLGFRSFLQLT